MARGFSEEAEAGTSRGHGPCRSSVTRRVPAPGGRTRRLGDGRVRGRGVGVRCRRAPRHPPLPARSGADELLEAVLEAGHRAPSVGHSQPWRFIVVSDQATRDKAAHLADAARLAQADHLTEDRAARLLDLKLEGLREAPLGIVVACDRRTPALGVLGRATFPDADLWSCATAIENMWLTARAHGLGMGWVTLFDPRRPGRPLRAARRRRHPRLALPGLARRATSRARPATGRLVDQDPVGRRRPAGAVEREGTGPAGLAPAWPRRAPSRCGDRRRRRPPRSTGLPRCARPCLESGCGTGGSADRWRDPSCWPPRITRSRTWA
jgi:5,6-dimethylbenzimidazole synthase